MFAKTKKREMTGNFRTKIKIPSCFGQKCDMKKMRFFANKSTKKRRLFRPLFFEMGQKKRKMAEICWIKINIYSRLGKGNDKIKTRMQPSIIDHRTECVF